MNFSDTDAITLEGVLIPFAWGSSGEVLEVAFTTFDEREYRIDPEATRDHGLKDLLRRHVRLTAMVRRDHVMQVRRVEVLGRRDTD